MKEQKESKYSFLQTLVVAVVCAAFVRSFFFEPFHIPSSSMKPELLVGDYIFVSKFSYGYSRYSFPFGINFFEGRVFKSSPKRGDVAVFRLPTNPRINYVKRIIGLPGDKIQIKSGVVYINDVQVSKINDGFFKDENYEMDLEIPQFTETLPEGKTIKTLDQRDSPQDDTGIYEVPQGHYFMMGDNRDNSQDSRFQDLVGFVPEQNLVGRALFVFFSSEKPVWQIWNWTRDIRFERIFKKLN
ncbi:MAG: signal peptidase I [Pelagibacterales bacterium]|nr:signal peptidase I [Pelagibacterales bacterium]